MLLMIIALGLGTMQGVRERSSCWFFQTGVLKLGGSLQIRHLEAGRDGSNSSTRNANSSKSVAG